MGRHHEERRRVPLRLRAPDFWRHGRGPWPRVLAPLSRIYARKTAERLTRPGFTAPIPVICCGNVTAGGAGKTTVAMNVASRLIRRGIAAHLLCSGYGGTLKGPIRVDPALHDSAAVGDEALLLARIAPTWISRDRGASARLAVGAGAEALVLDDGLQTPTLTKSLSLLVIDGTFGFGNGRVIPAGPLREPAAVGAARCQAAVLISNDETGVLAVLPPSLPVLRARLVPAEGAEAVAGRPVLAFAGIANPQKFFDTMTEAGAILVGRETFADHYPFDEGDLEALAKDAASLRAQLVCTPKDHVRLPPAWREKVVVVGASLAWADEAALDALLAPLFPGRLMVPPPAPAPVLADPPLALPASALPPAASLSSTAAPVPAEG
jgi:tetraacyldisaccharide 4'-kinase